MAGADDPKNKVTVPGKPGSSPPPTSATAGTAILDPSDALAATHAAAAAADGSPSLVGTVIANRYKVTKRLGEGGMGTVYEALHTVLEKQVALKVLHPELARKPQLVERFLQEAKAASRIRHENVIDISDFGSADGHVYFAMELLEGHDLHEDITRARRAGKLLPWERSKHIFLQVCSALSAAHNRNIIHRDLKPENIYLVQFRGDPDFVKLLDFGIAKMTDVSTSEEGRKLTKTGMLFGTPEYMAPEQARGEPIDARVDVYAMGCILFLLVTNKLPFQADNFMGVLAQHLTEEPPEIAPEVFDQIGAPQELADVIDRALAKNRDERWQTIDDLVAAICEACGEPLPQDIKSIRAESVDAPGETTRSRTPSGSQRMRTPTGPQRSKTPSSAPGRSKPPTGPTRPRPPTSPGKTPEVSWVGSTGTNIPIPTTDRASGLITLGPVPEPEQKSPVMAIISAIVVIAIVAAGGYFLFGRKSAAPVATTGSGSAMQPTPTETALPDMVDVVIDSTPSGATVYEGGTALGVTPYAAKVPGSSTTRHYKLSLEGYDDFAVDVLPNRPKVEMKPWLVKSDEGSAAGSATKPSTTGAKPTTTGTKPTTSGTKPTTTTTTQPDSSKPDTSTGAVTKPDTSGAVTTPDTAPVTKPDPTETKPVETPPPPPPPPADTPSSP